MQNHVGAGLSVLGQGWKLVFVPGQVERQSSKDAERGPKISQELRKLLVAATAGLGRREEFHCLPSVFGSALSHRSPARLSHFYKFIFVKDSLLQVRTQIENFYI